MSLTTQNVTGNVTLLYGSQGSNTGVSMMIINTDAANTIYVSDTSTVTYGGTNGVPLGPGAQLGFSGSVSLYAVSAGPTVAVAMVPNGTSYFLPASLNNLGGARVYVQAGQPTGNIPANSIWFDTSNSSLLTYTAGAWQSQTFNAALLLQAATILGSQIASETITAANIGSLSSALVGPTGALNPNPYFTGSDKTGWVANGGSFTVVSGSSLPSGSPYPYAAYWVASGTTTPFNLDETNGKFGATAGQQYLATAWINTESSYIALGIDWYDGTTLLSTSYEQVSPVLGQWSEVSYVFTAPATATSGSIKVIAETGVTFYATGITVTGQVPGSLIQSGSLTTAQLAAAAGILGNQIAQATITGSNIAANTIEASNIAANTITAAQLAAGIVYAGIINGTTVNAATFSGSTFEGTDFFINTNGAFFYSSDPATGNLTASVTPAAGTNDGYGNQYKEGLTVYSPDYPSSNGMINIAPFDTEALIAMSPTFTTPSGVSTWYLPQINVAAANSGDQSCYFITQFNSGCFGTSGNSAIILYGNSPDGTTSLSHITFYVDNAGTTEAVLDLNWSTGLTAMNPASSGVNETWHDMTLDTDWVNSGSPFPNAQYRLLPDGNIQLRGLVTYTGTSTGNIDIATLPSEYYCAYDYLYAAQLSNRSSWQFSGSTGLIEARNLTSTTNNVELNAIIPIN